MLGVILCGGDSKRMGRDKGLIPAAARTWAAETGAAENRAPETWAALAAKKMMALGIPVVLSVNERQLPTYASVFSRDWLIPDDPTLSVKGPLAGLLSVHGQAPFEDLFVLACDLPLMEPVLLQALFSRRSARTDSQAYVYTIDGEHEPLCGIYTADGLAKITGLYRAQRLVKHSMKYALEQLSVDCLAVPEDKRRCFENFNYPSGAAGDTIHV